MTRAEEIAWAAGLFEGEGCISRYITTKRSREYRYWQLKTTSTDLDVLERFALAVGCGRIYKQKRENPDWKPAYQHRVYRQPDVRATLLLLRPFMLGRRGEKMDEALADMDEALADMLGREYRPARRRAGTPG